MAPGDGGPGPCASRCAGAKLEGGGPAAAQRKTARWPAANLALHAQAACWLAGSAISEGTKREFELVMSLAPDQTSSAGPWYSRVGQCYEHARDTSRATRAFQAAIDLDPDTEGHYFRLAHLFPREGTAGPASEEMTRAIAHFPRSVTTRVEAGRIELEAGNPERALELQHQAATLDPQFPGVLSLLGRIQLAHRRYSEAIATLEQAAKLSPADAGIHFYAGQAWMKTEQGTARALDHFKRSLELDPNRAITYYWLGSLYFHRLHDYRVAAQYLEQAVDRSPELDAAPHILLHAYNTLREDKQPPAPLPPYQAIVQQRAKAEAPE